MKLVGLVYCKGVETEVEVDPGHLLVVKLLEVGVVRDVVGSGVVARDAAENAGQLPLRLQLKLRVPPLAIRAVYREQRYPSSRGSTA